MLAHIHQAGLTQLDHVIRRVHDGVWLAERNHLLLAVSTGTSVTVCHDCGAEIAKG
jgi:hypothetical protein